MYKYFLKLLIFTGDFLACNFAAAFIFWVRFKSGFLPDTYNPEKTLLEYSDTLFVLWAYWIILFLFSGLYRNWTKESRFDQAFVVFRTIVTGCLFIFLATGYEQFLGFFESLDWRVVFTTSKAVTLLQYGLSLILFCTLDRILLDTLFKKLLIRGIGADNVAVVGANESGLELMKKVERYPALGYHVIGFVDDDRRKKGNLYEGLPVLGIYSELPHLCAKHKISSVLISKVSSSPNEILKIIQYCAPTKVAVHMEPDLMDVVKGHVKTHQLYGFPLLILLPEHMPGWEVSVKKFMDIFISVVVLTAGLPVWLFIALLIKTISKGPVIYHQERIGQNGKPFILHKYRTMVANAEAMTGPVWAGAKDPRITRIGRILRKTRLDEIPQFLNVLKGEMSLVGPRPERAFFIEKLKEEIPLYARRLKMKPGITGWAQVKHHYDTSIEDVKQKIIYDMYYFENMSIRLDLKILFLSVWVVFTGKGAH